MVPHVEIDQSHRSITIGKKASLCQFNAITVYAGWRLLFGSDEQRRSLWFDHRLLSLSKYTNRLSKRPVVGDSSAFDRLRHRAFDKLVNRLLKYTNRFTDRRSLWFDKLTNRLSKRPVVGDSSAFDRLRHRAFDKRLLWLDKRRFTERDVSLTKKNVPLTKKNVPLTKKNVPLTKKNVPLTEKNVPLTKRDVYLVVRDVFLVVRDVFLTVRNTEAAQSVLMKRRKYSTTYAGALARRLYFDKRLVYFDKRLVSQSNQSNHRKRLPPCGLRGPPLIIHTALIMERTFVMLKPGVLQRRIVGEVLSRFERKGLKIIALRMMRVSADLVKAHYAEHIGKEFYDKLVEYTLSGPIIAMILEGEEAIGVVRRLTGPTDVHASAPGTIRGDFAAMTRLNIVHASDTPANAAREIALFFKDADICEWEDGNAAWYNQ